MRFRRLASAQTAPARVIHRVIDHAEAGGRVDVLLSAVAQSIPAKLRVIEQVEELSAELQAIPSWNVTWGNS
jgi:hypothetical protein